MNGVALPAPKHALPCHLCQLSQKGKQRINKIKKEIKKITLGLEINLGGYTQR